MCGRYTLYNLKFSKLKLNQNITPNYNINPGSKVLVFGKERRLFYAIWQLRVPWIKNLKIINARIETIEKKKVFVNTKRCVFIANGYFEWKRDDKKIPFYHTFKNEMMYFAGLINDFGACIVTCENSNKYVHNRKPVILEYSNFDKWLNRQYIHKYNNNKTMEIFQVSEKVNFTSNNNYLNIVKKNV